MGLKKRIFIYLQKCYDLDPTRWVHKGEICDLARETGYSHENAGRLLRELRAEGARLSENFIDRQLNSKGHAEYKFKKTRYENSIFRCGRRSKLQNNIATTQRIYWH